MKKIMIIRENRSFTCTSTGHKQLISQEYTGNTGKGETQVGYNCKNLSAGQHNISHSVAVVTKTDHSIVQE